MTALRSRKSNSYFQSRNLINSVTNEAVHTIALIESCNLSSIKRLPDIHLSQQYSRNHRFLAYAFSTRQTQEEMFPNRSQHSHNPMPPSRRAAGHAISLAHSLTCSLTPNPMLSFLPSFPLSNVPSKETCNFIARRYVTK